MRRRDFLAVIAGAAAARPASGAMVQTVRGPVPVSKLGSVLIHEHILVDFIGADQVSPGRYNTGEVLRAALPKIEALKNAGCGTLVECTPEYLGRDVALLGRISEAAGLHILTNTGYYGANGGKHLPAHALGETAEQLAERWSTEVEKGIDGTGIKPAFQKIGVNAGKLSGIDRKLIVAAGLCHRKTGLRFHVHTGDGIAAADILDTLREQGIPPSAYVWVHAQNEPNREMHILAARAGAWVEFDGVSESGLDQHVRAVGDMLKSGFLDHVLVSQDSGWYHVGEPGGGQFKGYTYLYESFLPALRKSGITDQQIRRLMVDNPARVLTPETTPRPASAPAAAPRRSTAKPRRRVPA